MAKEYSKQLAFKPNEKSSTTNHAEGNSMASPTQTVVGKGISKSLIAENLLKILRDPFPSDSTVKDRGKCWPLSPT